MCKYCEETEVIASKDVISDFNWGWGKDQNGEPIKISEQDAARYPIGVFIDRGYIRLVDLDDCNCLDNGEKVKIEFCPFCGKKL